MQFGIRLHDAVKAPIEERLKIVKEQGFTCAHVALSKVISENSVAPEALTPGYAMYLKRLFDKNELDCAVLGCYLNLANPDATQLKAIQEKYKANIRFAAHLGAGVVGTETGAPNVEYKFEEACWNEESLQIFIKNLRPVVKYAEQMGVLMAIEPVVRHIVCNPVRARRVLDEIDSPNLRIILDPVNLLESYNYEKQDEIIDEVIELLGKDVAVLHVKDFVIKDGKLISVPVGQGQCHWDRIIPYMKKEKPFMHATLEDTKPDNAVAALHYIMDIYKNA
ncbi:MAG: sugar phosphate isomerase/epimerase [Lachnospiraceae bacterium]|nr:sugar phosphate isomerase/epimerase [Lachnospiraceae bacterium]MDE7203968.1 sugar phosphate isomerase/epimerase [Lachnospiraceae bacterium]